MRKHQQQRVAGHTSPSSSEAEADANVIQTETDQDMHLESYVLMVDPATGEVILEAEASAGTENNAEGNGVQRVGTENTVDDFVKLLRKSIESALEQVSAGEQGEDQKSPSVEQKQAHQQSQQHQSQQQPDKPLRGKGKYQDTMSRLNKAGAHNHKAIAEQFLNGKLTHKRNIRETQPHLQQPETQQLPLPPRQLGTSQHRNLKKAFETRWDEDEEDQKQRTKDEL